MAQGFHAWKGRIGTEEQGYPFYNGPAFFDSSNGKAFLPGADSPSPYAGMSDTVTGSDITFSGTLTAETIIGVWMALTEDATGKVEYAGSFINLFSGSPAAEAATFVAADLDASPLVLATSAGGVVSFTVEAGWSLAAIDVGFGPGLGLAA